MRRISLRWRITLWSSLATGVALLVFGAAVITTLWFEQVEVIDTQLATDARFAFAFRADRGGAELDSSAWVSALPGADVSLKGFAFGLDPRGDATAARPQDLARVFRERPAGRTAFTAAVGNGKLRFGVFSERGMTLLLAASLEPARESVGDLLGAYAIALPIVLALAAGGSWWIARRALEPVVAITQATSSLTADRLGERLPVPETDDEIGRHVRVLNGMFDRLQRSFEQANRFTADAAHELRTPLTIMRGQIEEALRSGGWTPGQEQLLLGLLEENAGLQKISENLLMLARFDSGKYPLQMATVDLSALVSESLEDAELLAAGSHVRVSGRIAPGVLVRGDALMLRRAVLNLVDNAVKFNRSGGEVLLALARGNETFAADGSHSSPASDPDRSKEPEGAGLNGATLIVGNTGPGIPAEKQGRLFERFYRVVEDRNRDSGGSGLGLSLCREIASAHGGHIELTRSDDAWTEFTIRLPP